MSDPQWEARRKSVAAHWPSANNSVEDVTSRYLSHDELRYSLRSAEMYAPWLRHIFLVVSDDNTLPSWLNRDNPRLRIVRHSEIIPQEYLPTYDSVTIEHFIWRIPDLSEHFLYANDDMFFAAPVSPRFFFDANGEPIRRVSFLKFSPHDTLHYYKTLYNAVNIIKAAHPDTPIDIRKTYYLLPHHNIDAYRKSHNTATFEKYKEQISTTFSCPFRQETDIQRVIYLLEEVVSYGATTEIVSKFHNPVSITFFHNECREGISDIFRLRPKMLCLNSSNDSTSDDFEYIRLAMDVLFPEPSSFEIS